MRPTAPRGKVYLVGAGPGDPGLITLRGAQCLARADVVLYDYLANPRLLQHARAGAELVCLGRHGQGRLWSQAEINGRLVEGAMEGKLVVRLKGGDPAVFARTAEEVQALTSAGVAYEIVPGITAALAVSSYAGIPLTHRDGASAVALVTGQQREGDSGGQEPLDYAALARFPGTLVFYMGVTTARHWVDHLIAAGKPPGTPAAIVRRCSWPDQAEWHCVLSEVPGVLAAGQVRPPVLVVVGDVVTLAEAPHWFARRPLFGERVLVTRPLEQAGSLLARLEELGAEVLVQPAIEISPPDDWAGVDSALQRLEDFDWLVFSSSNGVRYLLDRLEARGEDLRRLGQVRLAAIGPGTAEELARYRLKADLLPDEYRAEALAASLATQARGKRFLLVRASRGREVLAEELSRAGGSGEQVVVYQSRDVARPEASIDQSLREGKIQWITVTSSAIARSLAALFGEHLRKARLASISPITSATLGELGFDVAVEARQYTMEGLVEAILEAILDASAGRP